MKTNYTEPAGYFNKQMLDILKKGEKKNSDKKPEKKPTSKAGKK